MASEGRSAAVWNQSSAAKSPPQLALTHFRAGLAARGGAPAASGTPWFHLVAGVGWAHPMTKDSRPVLEYMIPLILPIERSPKT
jgi:hypothetical protein